MLSLHFNSIKVRLKQNVTYSFELVRQLFQFHKGTIKTEIHHFAYYRGMNFNSIKVRLKQCKDFGHDSDYRFQFHKGTIKT